MFGTEPTRVETDYAKWMLKTRRQLCDFDTRTWPPGSTTWAFRSTTPKTCKAMKAQAQAADLSLIDEGATTCCYAKSDKHWIVDPQGLPWEHFQTRETFPCSAKANRWPHNLTRARAAPKVTGKPVGIPVKSSCC